MLFSLKSSTAYCKIGHWFNFDDFSKVRSIVICIMQMKEEMWAKSQKDPPSCTTNYLPWNNSDPDYPPSCTSSGCMLHLFKVLSVLVHPLRRSCAYKKYGQTGWFLSTPQIFDCGGIMITIVKLCLEEVLT